MNLVDLDSLDPATCDELLRLVKDRRIRELHERGARIAAAHEALDERRPWHTVGYYRRLRQEQGR